jgi:nucleotide-binding universal stress UspA family protein
VTEDFAASLLLVGVSYDETGESALRLAIEMARGRPKVALHAAHVLPESALANRSGGVAQHGALLATHPQHVVDFVKPFLRGWFSEVVVHVRVGDPAQQLLQLALDYDADLLVVGTHGRRGLERLALGSVAQALLDARRVPIVIAAPRNFGGMEKTVLDAPTCADCIEARRASHGQRLWCATHAPIHVPTSLRLAEDGKTWVPVGGIDPGLVA